MQIHSTKRVQYLLLMQMQFVNQIMESIVARTPMQISDVELCKNC